MDRDQKIVFFTPRGRALRAAPPRLPKRRALERRGARMTPGAGTPRWKRDSHIPWEVEAKAWEALDSG
ncbi:MAG: hypothetical protein HKO65_00670 [Gemmatimonadetes bacterium]|nr:hypothetical protein [Gemmatimonadota bacterium]